MKKYLLFTLIAIFLLNACASSALPPATEAVIPTATATFSPTYTPTLSTPTITPLPTIPTFTPTFDASTIVTVTPAPKAECPKENSALVPNFEFPNLTSCMDGWTQEECYPRGFEQKFLEYLNSGGSVKSLLDLYYSSGYLKQNSNDYFHQDVTGDDVPDLMLYDLALFPNPNIYYCSNGKYELYSYDSQGDHIDLEEIKDINQNGIPELVFTMRGCSGSGCFGVVTLEWNGKTFQDLSPDAGSLGVKAHSIRDVDENKLEEIIITGDRPGSCCVGMMMPWRYKTVTYAWNGNIYSESYVSFDKAQYRFQSIQDADREVLYGNLDKALIYYQEAISDKELEWWSKERRDFEVKIFYDSYKPVTPTPLPYPIEDKSEYPRLAAYAYYRIMLLHLAQGQEPNADTAYDTLQQTFGSDPYGRPYAEMATAFQDIYQSTQKMYDGCAAAIQYATEHPEVLIPLGSDYHGAQSHTYKPEDVCPFR